MKDSNELEIAVQIDRFNNRFKQYIKFQEESNELARALLKDNDPEIMDAIGDITVTLIILADQLGMPFTQCLRLAYDEIKNREGRTENGIFIKD